jgi:dTDP-4-amino-4,6-dideoxygalactose transaminase
VSALTHRIAARQDADAIVARRRRNYFFLLTRLRDVAPPLFQELPARTCPLFYPLLVPEKSHALVQLAHAGVEAVDFWRHFHPRCEPSAFPETAALRERVLELPCHQDLDLEAMDRIAAAARRLLEQTAVDARRRARG